MSDGVTFDRDELTLMRQWYDCLRDANPGYLEVEDTILAEKIAFALSRFPEVPPKDGIAAIIDDLRCQIEFGAMLANKKSRPKPPPA